jgi:PPM family protein phosphatase
MSFLSAHICEAGGRDVNQDASGDLATPNGTHCWVLADGLGGHAGGEVAAQVCVQEVLNAFESDPRLSEQTLRRCIEAAQRAILERQRASQALSEMRSTVVVLIADAKAALWAHVGDSRLYHLRAGRIIAQTQDHSVPQVLVAAGDLQPREIRQHADRNRLLRSLGQPGEIQPAIESRPQALRAGDAFLLCSDGFWELVYETEIEADFAKADHPEEWLATLHERLRRRTVPGSDNYSAVGVFVTGR